MFVNHFLSLSIKANWHYLNRYLRFVTSRPNLKIKHHTHHHHILPKSKSFFPNFKDLKKNPWNGVHLTAREHFIAHWMLHRAFTGSTQTRAFYLMCNEQRRITSRSYEEAKNYHRSQVKAWNADITSRSAVNSKISQSLKGKPKSSSHRSNMVGHLVSVATREKLRVANLGKKHTDESKTKMSISRLGATRSPHTQETKEKISAARTTQQRKWFNNGVESKQFSEPPVGWVRGRLPWIKK